MKAGRLILKILRRKLTVVFLQLEHRLSLTDSSQVMVSGLVGQIRA